MADLELIHKEIKRYVNKKLVKGVYLFFNILLHKFHWKLDYHCPEDALAYVRFKDKDINELADGTIWISSKLMENPEFNSSKYLFVLFHEIFHIIFQHNTRRGNRNHLIWNLAADHLINSLLRVEYRNDIEPPLGWDHLFIDPSIPSSYRTTEEIYDFLEQKMDQFEIISQKNLQGGITQYTVRDKKTGQTYEITVSENNNQREEEFGRTVSNIYNSIKERGDLSHSLKECFDSFFDSTLPWQEVLKNIIRKAVVSVPNDRGWRTLNKFFRPHGYILPGIVYEDNPKYGVCILSVDTSGSINSDELQEFANILVESLNHFNKIILITHDYSIQQVLSFNHKNFDQVKEFIKMEGFRGRGGTSHQEVFDRIQKIQEEESEKISIYLSLTDGYSDIDEMWPQNLWSSRNNIQTYFIITKYGRSPKVSKNSQNPKTIFLK